MKYLISFFLLLSSLFSFGQAPGYFTIKGNVKNFDADFFELSVTEFIENKVSSVKVDEKGNFSSKIAIDGQQQDIYLYLNDDAITIFASVGDTLLLNWDHKDFYKTFRMSSPNLMYRQDLALSKELYEKTRQPMLKLNESLNSEKLTDAMKCQKINESYNSTMAIIAKHPYKDMKPLYDAFFTHINLLTKINQIDKFKLTLNVTFDEPRQSVAKKLDHRYLSSQIFRLSPTYREFIFNNVYFYLDSLKEESAANEPFVTVPEIREWFLARTIMDEFEFYDFKESKEKYDRFLSDHSGSKFANILKQYYSAVSKLAPGQPAPQFSLKDVNNKTVALKDFVGKVVYIDFWGVYCGPCIADIRKSGKKVHDKYLGKDVVFINICVDEKGDKWKEKIKSLSLTGINLVAEGWTNNEVCKVYNVHAIPHYVLIGKDGKIINNNASTLDELAMDEKNELDKAL